MPPIQSYGFTANESFEEFKAAVLKTTRRRLSDWRLGKTRYKPAEMLNASFIQDERWQERIGDVVSHTWAESTSAKYRSRIKEYQRFCAELKILKNLWLPASDDILCAFAANMAGKNAGKTVRNDLAAIRAWHIQNNLPWEQISTRLNYVLRGCEKLTPADARKEPQKPVTAEMLRFLIDTLDRNDKADLAILFVTSACFWGQLCGGELCPKSPSIFNPSFIPSVKHLSLPDAKNARKLHLPSTKTKGPRGVLQRNSFSIASSLSSLPLSPYPSSRLLSPYHAYLLASMCARLSLSSCSTWNLDSLDTSTRVYHMYKLIYQSVFNRYLWLAFIPIPLSFYTVSYLVCALIPHVYKLRWRLL